MQSLLALSSDIIYAHSGFVHTFYLLNLDVCIRTCLELEDTYIHGTVYPLLIPLLPVTTTMREFCSGGAQVAHRPHNYSQS